MHSNGIIQSGLSGKKFTNTRVDPLRLKRRMTSGPTGPPLMTSDERGPQARHRRSSRQPAALIGAFVPWFL